MDPREIQALAHDVLSEHLELRDATNSGTTPSQLPEAATRT